jgi:hypothetical protein
MGALLSLAWAAYLQTVWRSPHGEEPLGGKRLARTGALGCCKMPGPSEYRIHHALSEHPSSCAIRDSCQATYLTFGWAPHVLSSALEAT